MYFLPCLAQFGDVIQQLCLNVAQLVICKTEICPQTHWASRTIQVENGAVSLPDDVYMSRTMVIGVNGHPQSANPQNGWHELSYHKPKRLG
jgi:hypothetical protein